LEKRGFTSDEAVSIFNFLYQLRSRFTTSPNICKIGFKIIQGIRASITHEENSYPLRIKIAGHTSIFD
jgi:hypothetical protein